MSNNVAFNFTYVPGEEYIISENYRESRIPIWLKKSTPLTALVFSFLSMSVPLATQSLIVTLLNVTGLQRVSLLCTQWANPKQCWPPSSGREIPGVAARSYPRCELIRLGRGAHHLVTFLSLSFPIWNMEMNLSALSACYYWVAWSPLFLSFALFPSMSSHDTCALDLGSLHKPSQKSEFSLSLPAPVILASLFLSRKA